MIQRLVGFCLMAVGFSIARPLSSSKGMYVPVPPGSRPACAEKTLTFCEKVDNYPSDIIAKLLKSSKFSLDDFLIDESEGLDEPPEFILKPEPLKEEKIRKSRSVENVFEGLQLAEKCSVPSRMATPKIASNSNGEWRFIAQEETLKIHQKAKVHLCAETVQCQKCIQFYSPTPMKSLSSSGSFVEDIFWMPSSCRCPDDSENAV